MNSDQRCIKLRAQGRRAFNTGKAQYNNPYSGEDAADWDQGYEDAKQEAYGKYR